METSFARRMKEQFDDEVCVKRQDDISVTVELPLRTGWGPFKTAFRDERTVHSLSEVETLVQQYFTPSHEDLRAALRVPDAR